MDDFDLDSVLGDILNDSKPLPVAITTPVREQPVNLVPETIAAQADAFPTPMPTQDVQPFADTATRTDYALPELALPQFTTDDIAATLDIRNFATLVTLNTARWHAKVKDRKASQDAATANNADEHAFETRKRLLAGADEKLKAIHKCIDEARADYYGMTLPWTTTSVNDVGRRTGARMLANTLFFEFITKMGERKAAMKAALAEFVPVYPALIEQAKKNLGGRFDISEYPLPESIEKHFDLTFDFQPIPLGSDFKGLPDQQAQALADAIAGKTRTMLENAMQDLWARAHEAVGRMAERLSHPDKLFHYTLVENVRAVSGQLLHLNVTGDPRVKEIQQYVDKHLCPADIEALRTVPTVRMETAAHAQTVLEMMARYGKGV